MINPRRAFLESFFRIMEERAVPYCVLRNYEQIYENNGSDVDLAMEPEHLLAAKDCLGLAAAETGHHFVLRARYVNYSYVYWHPEGEFLRIDLETEIRWRQLPVLTARSVVGLRRKFGAFYIPHPRHETAIILVAAIWRVNISERYRNQLAALFAQHCNLEELRRTFRCAFGSKGDALANFTSQALTQEAGPALWHSVRRALWWNALVSPPKRWEFLGYLAGDSRRLFERLLHPPGISLLIASNTADTPELDTFFRKIRMLYPTEKVTTYLFHPAPQGRLGRLGIKLRLQRLYSIFKGGLFMRRYQVSSERDVATVLKSLSRYLYPTRTFACAEVTGQDTWLSHVETGFTVRLVPRMDQQFPHDDIIQFISAVLEHYREGRHQAQGRPGRWLVLVTDDAAQFRHLAFSLTAMPNLRPRFSRVRLFNDRLTPVPNNIAPGVLGDGPADSSRGKDYPAREMPHETATLSGRLRAGLMFPARLRGLLRRNSLVITGTRDLPAVSVNAVPEAGKSPGKEGSRPDLIVVLKSEASAPGVTTSAGGVPMAVVDGTRPAAETARQIWELVRALDRATAEVGNVAEAPLARERAPDE